MTITGRNTRSGPLAAAAAVAALLSAGIGVNAYAAPALAAGMSPQNWGNPTETATLTSADGVNNDEFGFSVSTAQKGKVVAVGAPYHDGYAGAVYLFSVADGTWTQTAEITPEDPVQFDQFGWSVSLSQDGSTLAVSSPFKVTDGSYYGTVYVFQDEGGTWTQVAELTDTVSIINEDYGVSVSMSGNGSELAVGSEYGADGSGAAFIYSDSGGAWTQTAELTDPNGAQNDLFGNSVALSRNGSAVAVGDPDFGTNLGQVLVFNDSSGSWSQTGTLTASGGADYDAFGYSVAISSNGKEIVTGAEGLNNYAGGAYVFMLKKGSWTQKALLTGSDSVSGDLGGWSVSMSGNGHSVAIGAWAHGDANGVAYMFVHHGSTWRQSSELVASDGVQYEESGYAVAVSSNGAETATGAIVGGEGGTGSVHLFHR